MVTTTYGEIEEEYLIKRVGRHDDENETAEWVEYRLRDALAVGGEAGELVHRSAHVTLKKPGTGAEAFAAALG